MKIALVSPAFPLRGGIAQHAGSLYHKLRERQHEVLVITFKRQYPGIFFPGKTQLETSEDERIKIPSEPVIDSIGPWTWIKAFRHIKRFQPDLLVFTYWMPFFAPCLGTIALLVRKFTDIRIVFLCHNIIPHERRPGDIVLTRYAFCYADYFIVQSGAVEKQLLRLLPQAKYKVIPHPVYDVYGNLLNKNAARKQLGIAEEKVILFFGYVREYKGLDLLLNAMPKISQKIKLRLLIVGEFYEDENKYDTMIDELNIREQVSVFSEFIPNERVNLFFSAADVLVLPYKSATQSGIVQMAYHFNKPCIVTDVGGLSEVVIDGKTGFVVPPDSPEKIASAVVRFYSENRKKEFSQQVNIEKRKYSWERMVEAIEDFMN